MGSCPAVSPWACCESLLSVCHDLAMIAWLTRKRLQAVRLLVLISCLRLVFPCTYCYGLAKIVNYALLPEFIRQVSGSKILFEICVFSPSNTLLVLSHGKSNVSYNILALLCHGVLTQHKIKFRVLVWFSFHYGCYRCSVESYRYVYVFQSVISCPMYASTSPMCIDCPVWFQNQWWFLFGPVDAFDPQPNCMILSWINALRASFLASAVPLIFSSDKNFLELLLLLKGARGGSKSRALKNELLKVCRTSEVRQKPWFEAWYSSTGGLSIYGHFSGVAAKKKYVTLEPPQGEALVVKSSIRGSMRF